MWSAKAANSSVSRAASMSMKLMDCADVARRHLLRLEAEIAVRQREHLEHRVLALEIVPGGVHRGCRRRARWSPSPSRVHVEHAALPRQLEQLQDLAQADLSQVPLQGAHGAFSLDAVVEDLRARDEIARVEGLDQVIVGPGSETPDLRLLAAMNREKDEGDVRRSSGRCRSRSQNASPSISGMEMSETMMSTGSRETISSASLPLTAFTTTKPPARGRARARAESSRRHRR